jgi:dTDP-glucose 4,6-dehydratase
VAPNPLADDLEHILTHTRGLWDELRGRRLFLTGGTGFFGCWLLESFAWANDRLDLGAEAVVLTRNPDAFRRKAPHLAGHPAVRLHQGDVRDFRFPDGPFSHVIHAATEASAALNDEQPLVMLDTVVEGTRRAMEFARHKGARKFLLTSSGAVYGRQPSDLTHVPEGYPGAPDVFDHRSAYGEGKRLAEHLCVLSGRCHGLEPRIARCFAFLGPYLPLDIHYAAGNFLRDGLRGGPIQVGGDGTPWRSYLYAADLAVWLWTLLFRGTPCRAYNVGSDQGVTIADLARATASVCGSSCTVSIARQPVPGRPTERYVPSVARARAECGLEVRIGLEEALRRTVAWHRRNLPHTSPKRQRGESILQRQQGQG